MPLLLSQLAVDASDPGAQARWWQQVLGGRVEDSEPDEVTLVLDGGPPGLLFLRVPEAKTVKNRLHLDVRPPDGSSQEVELRRLLDLGARPADVGQGPDVTWVVLADPEGNEFCLLRGTPGEVGTDEAEVEEQEIEQAEVEAAAHPT